jgi:hypothetical protein
MPDASKMTLQSPELVHKNGAYGIKIRAEAPSIHMIRVDIDTQISPIIGGEEQAKELISYLSSEDYRRYAYTYEHLLVYYTFRYFPRAAYDFNLPEKARFAVFCTLVIRDLDALRYAERNEFSFADRVDIVKDFSKQVEHSDYNIDYLMEELLFL